MKIITRLASIATLVWFPAGATHAADAKFINAMTFGIGRSSCATWQSNQANRTAGSNWLLGFWTGLNAANTSNNLVGAKTDGLGIIAEVEKICSQRPSMDLMDATTAVYSALAQGK